MKTFKGILIREEGWIHENNDWAWNSLEELNTSGRTAAVRLRKCKRVMWGLLAAEFQIINFWSRKEEGKVKLFYLSKNYKWVPLIIT